MAECHLKKIVILFSGNGSNMQNLVDKLHNKSFDPLSIEVSALITNNPEAEGIKKAKAFDIPLLVLNHKEFPSREEFDATLAQKISEFEPDLVALAGFMRILTPAFIKRFKIVNIHPSLLPLFKGGNAIKESYFSDMKVGGVSVHYVNEELDGGEIIEQACLKKMDKEGLQEYEARIHALEHEIYPVAVLKALC